MSEAKHTPGPWTLQTENVPPNNWGLPFQIHDKDGLVLTGTAASRTDCPDDLLPIDVAYENLRAIKAAPELAKGARAFVEWVKTYGDDMHPQHLDAMENAFGATLRAAIAKVKST